MKYYCKNCMSEFKPGNKKLSLPPVDDPSVHCPFCEKKDVEFGVIPDYETPEQFQERTGKAYPDNGAVWYRLNYEFEWELDTYRYVEGRYSNNSGLVILCADPPVPPPDDWRPE